MAKEERESHFSANYK